jgi:hypothetical protein
VKEEKHSHRDRKEGFFLTIDMFKEILDREGEGIPSIYQVKVKRKQRLM